MKLLNKDIYNQINKKTLIYKNFNLFIKYINYKIQFVFQE